MGSKSQASQLFILLLLEFLSFIVIKTGATSRQASSSWSSSLAVQKSSQIPAANPNFEAAFQGECSGRRKQSHISDDADENPCQQICLDLHDGTYECSCFYGFALAVDGYSCTKLVYLVPQTNDNKTTTTTTATTTTTTTTATTATTTDDGSQKYGAHFEEGRRKLALEANDSDNNDDAEENNWPEATSTSSYALGETRLAPRDNEWPDGNSLNGLQLDLAREPANKIVNDNDNDSDDEDDKAKDQEEEEEDQVDNDEETKEDEEEEELEKAPELGGKWIKYNTLGPNGLESKEIIEFSAPTRRDKQQLNQAKARSIMSRKTHGRWKRRRRLSKTHNWSVSSSAVADNNDQRQQQRRMMNQIDYDLGVLESLVGKTMGDYYATNWRLVGPRQSNQEQVGGSGE